MNNETRSGRYTAWIIISFFMAITALSCKKTGPTVADISVLDRNKAPVAGATVTLWQDTAVNSVNGVKSTLRVTKLSDAGGKADFNFEQESFLNIEVINGVDTGRSFIRLKEHETVEQTVNF